MNIAFFTDTYAPQINGVVTSLKIFKRELERQGHRVYIFAPSFGGREKKEEGVFRVFSIPYPTEAMREQRIVFPFCRTFLSFASLDIDIVHFHVPHYLSAYGIMLAKLWKVPIVHTYHTLFIHYTHYVKMRKSLAEKAVKFLSRNFCNHCVRILVPSPEVKTELSTYGVVPPIEIIPTGIEPFTEPAIMDEERLKRRYLISGAKKNLLFVGRFAREKNIDFLLTVMARLKADGKGYRLILAGDGPDRKRLEGLIEESDLKDCVTVTGYISRRRVFDLLRLSDLFVFPSATETQGLVLLEAMSVGLPVVAVDAMGVEDLLRDGRGGIAVAPGNLAGFIEAVEEILHNKELYEEKRLEGRRKAEEWSSETMTRKLVVFYKNSIRDFRKRRFGHL